MIFYVVFHDFCTIGDNFAWFCLHWQILAYFSTLWHMLALFCIPMNTFSHLFISGQKYDSVFLEHYSRYFDLWFCSCWSQLQEKFTTCELAVKTSLEKSPIILDQAKVTGQSCWTEQNLQFNSSEKQKCKRKSENRAYRSIDVTLSFNNNIRSVWE